MEDNYQKAYKEILEILKYVPEESVKKIPQEMRDMFEKEQLKTYDFQIDTSKTFEEQELLEETKAILANIFRDYWATPYQKERIEIKEKYDRQQSEEQKRKIYNPNDLFKNKNNRNPDFEKLSNLPIEVKKESFFKKIINFFKKKFHIE
jgi:hypothetical protein